VFAKWLLKQLQYLDAPIGLYRVFSDGSSRQERVPVKLDSCRLKSVCHGV